MCRGQRPGRIELQQPCNQRRPDTLNHAVVSPHAPDSPTPHPPPGGTDTNPLTPNRHIARDRAVRIPFNEPYARGLRIHGYELIDVCRSWDRVNSSRALVCGWRGWSAPALDLVQRLFDRARQDVDQTVAVPHLAVRLFGECATFLTHRHDDRRHVYTM